MRPWRALATGILVAALWALSAASAHAQPPAPVVLTEGWSYVEDPSHGEVAPTEGWEPVTIPHLFDRNPTESKFFGTVGWYRATFTAPETPDGFGWALRFDQVRRVADVWLDGERIGGHEDPYVPFTLPAGELAPGPHELLVRVDNRKEKEPREGWWNWGGIAKPVSLVAQGAIVAESPGLMAQRNCDDDGACRWSVLADAEFVNRSARRVAPRVAVRLRSPDGVVSEKTVAGRPLAAGERARLRFDVPIEGDARLWSPDDPQLYEATLQIRDGGSVEQQHAQRVGLRSIEVVDGLLEVNGKAVQLRGASIQEDGAGHGGALGDEDVEWIVRELKAVGANVTRAHYLLDERLLRRFDEEGILVWSQAPIYHRDRLLETEEQRREALATVRGTVLGARTHPSVMTHSVANELSVKPEETPTGGWLLDARALTRDLDPTIPVSVDLLSYPNYPKSEVYAKFPLLGINSYYGWYPGRDAPHSTAREEDLGPFLEAQHRAYPDSALVVTEFGAESTYSGPADVKETYEFQTDYLARVLETIESTPEIGGAIYWTLREFAVKPQWDGGAQRTGVLRDGIHNKGLITYDGRRKPAWEVLRANAAATPLWRDSEDVAAATGIRAPQSGGGGTGGITLAVLVLLGFAVLCVVDVWAFAGLRRAGRGAAQEDDRPDREPESAGGRRPSRATA